MEPLVSIIVPVYNVEKYINTCIKSIIGQTYKNLEIILVDDGTPDNSGEICEEYAKKDNRVTVIHKTNGGLSSARNAGLDIATGAYIMFVDSDDCLVDNAVEILVRDSLKYDADIVQFYLNHITSEESLPKQISYEYNAELITDLRQMYWKMFETVGSGDSACSKLYKSMIFDGLRFKEGIIHEDVYFTTFMLQKVKKALYLDISPYNYLIHSDSIITSAFSKKKLDGILVLETRINEFNRLGFTDLENHAKEDYFLKLITLWCSAKKVKDRESIKLIEEKINLFDKSSKFYFSRKMEIVYKLCKTNIKLLNFYYMYKKVMKQI
ncbi:MAG: glycosyltransferase [Clostridia bacterium]|nr:glycosyltransferase [Clostridia bacterium]